MPFQAKGIKNRLKSIRNTKKITRTMELVSAAKLRRAVEATLKTRPYSSRLSDIMNRLKSNASLLENQDLKKFFEIPATEIAYQRQQKKTRTTIILFTSNRGLCGGFNSHLVKKVVKYIRKRKGHEKIDIIAIGTKGVTLLSSYKISTEFAYRKEEGLNALQSLLPIAHDAFQKFSEGKTDKIVIAFTEYKTASTQKPSVKQLLPFPIQKTLVVEENPPTYLYEPGEDRLMLSLIPRIVEMELFQALLESNASEHSARMVAMKSAKDAATDMNNALSLSYNRARQASITQEIAEISAGFAAIS